MVPLFALAATAACAGASGEVSTGRASVASTTTVSPVTVGMPEQTTTSPAPPASSAPPSTAAPTTGGVTTTLAPATVPATTTPTTAAAPAASTDPCCASWTLEPYDGLGAWVDVYDWTNAHSKNNPAVRLGEIDTMADLGVRTLYIQTARPSSTTDVVEPDRLRAIIDRAHARGMYVVTWYLPTFENVELDLRRLTKAARLGVDGLSVNVESTVIDDVETRNRRLIELSNRLKSDLGGAPLANVVLNPFALDELKTDVWPDFPWAEIDPFYDVWQPMVYVTYRPNGDEYRDAEKYTAASMTRMKEKVAAGEPIHPVTGIGDRLTDADVDGYTRAAIAGGAVGGGSYDWVVTARNQWVAMTAFNN